MLLGVQVSSAGKIYEAIDRAAELGCNTMQIFSRNPRQWREGRLSKEDILEFDKRRRAAGIDPVFIHIPYLINLASPYPRLYKKSIKAYITDVKEAGRLRVNYIVTHLGSHKKTTEEAGLGRFIDALNNILEVTHDLGVGILLENTAGSGSWLGYKFQHQKAIIDGVKYKECVGLCLDTCHLYVAGYDISSKEGLDNALGEIDKLIGLKKIKLIHLNDAKDKLASHRDRHEDIGKGKIGLKGIKNIVHHPKLKGAAFILETPKREEGDDIRNLKTVRNL